MVLLHSLHAQTTLAEKPEFISWVVQSGILQTYSYSLHDTNYIRWKATVL